MIPVVILVSIPGLDSLVAELSGVKIVLESLEDCVGTADAVRSLFVSQFFVCAVVQARFQG